MNEESFLAPIKSKLSFNDYRSQKVDWIVGNGADACWVFAMSVQPALADLDEAARIGDVELAYESTLMALRGCYSCLLVADSGARSTQSDELHASIALSNHPLAQLIQAVQCSAVPTLSSLGRLVSVTAKVSEMVEAALPFQMPVVRDEQSAPKTMRLAATVTRVRGERNREALNWRR